MPSSISNSKFVKLFRVVPRRDWDVFFVVSVLLLLGVVGAWEWMCRRWEYRPTLNDNSYLWATQRVRVDADPDAIVLIGSSRMLFNANLDVLEQALGQRPIQLATVGTNPGPYLEHLAAHPTFRGVLLIGVTPGLFYAPAGPPVENATKNLDYYAKWGPSERLGGWLGVLLQERLAFIQQEDLSLAKLLDRIPLRNRPAVALPPPLPPYFYTMERDRQVRMIPYNTPRSLATRDKVRDGWVPLFTPPPFPADWTPEQIRAAVEGMVNDRIEKTRAGVERLHSKGGRVVFIRFPSTGGLKELEDKLTPRQPFWDALLEATRCPGIHFEDYESLRGFDCPEWSHLSAEDAADFSRRLAPLIIEALRSAGGEPAGPRSGAASS
jgi:hypothetical protein